MQGVQSPTTALEAMGEGMQERSIQAQTEATGQADSQMLFGSKYAEEEKPAAQKTSFQGGGPENMERGYMSRTEEAATQTYLPLAEESDQCCKADATQEITQAANAAELRQLLESQNYQCKACGISLTPETSAVDHKVPRAGGGTDEINNLQWLCEQCNRAKGTMQFEQFLAMCRRVAARYTRHPPPPFRFFPAFVLTQFPTARVVWLDSGLAK